MDGGAAFAAPPFFSFPAGERRGGSFSEEVWSDQWLERVWTEYKAEGIVQMDEHILPGGIHVANLDIQQDPSVLIDPDVAHLSHIVLKHIGIGFPHILKNL